MSMAREELADRIRGLLPPGVYPVEKRMFGGIAFIVQGNMLICPLKDGTLMVRVGKNGMDEALTRSGASIMEMKGRPMNGFILVSGDAIEDDDILGDWLTAAQAFVRTLPPK